METLAEGKQPSADRLPSTKRFPSAGVGDPAQHETALGERGGEKKKEGFTAVVQREAGIFRKNCKKLIGRDKKFGAANQRNICTPVKVYRI